MRNGEFNKWDRRRNPNMKDSLSKKIDEVKDTHAAETHAEIMSNHDARAKIEAGFILGRIKQNDHLSQAISANLDAQTVRALETFQKEKMFKALGFDTFDKFLDESEFSPMSKRQYYDRLALIRGHGDEIYDLLTSVGISVRAQKMLGHGDLAIKGDALVIGDQQIEMSNVGLIKDVLNEMFDEKRTLMADREKLKKQNDALKDQIARGTDENAELMRALDAMREGNPHDRSLARVVESLLEHTEVVGQMDDKAKAKKGANALETLWSVLLQVKKSYAIGFHFVEAAANGSSGDDFEAKLNAAINEPDDLDAEDNY